MKKSKPLRRDNRKVTLSLLPKTYAALNRHAPSHGVSNNRYGQMAIEFLIECEEAFGGPLTEQFREMTVKHLGRTQEKLRQLLAEG